jgi:inorganic pyrophosphatase
VSTVPSECQSAHPYWDALAELVRTTMIAVDRPRGSRHPRYPATIYPLDYGFLEGTTSDDGAGIDVWVGSLPSREVTAIVCTIDAELRTAETKILLGCTPQEMDTVLEFHNQGSQRALLLRSTRLVDL